MIDSRKSRVIDMYSDYTENKLQALTFAAITSVWISLQCCNLAYINKHIFMIFLGLVRLCEQNVLRTFTAADHKKPSSKSSSVSINKIQWFSSYWLG